LKLSEQYFRSFGASAGLIISYFCSGALGAIGVAESAMIWAASCVVGGFIGQRVYRFIFR